MNESPPLRVCEAPSTLKVAMRKIDGVAATDWADRASCEASEPGCGTAGGGCAAPVAACVGDAGCEGLAVGWGDRLGVGLGPRDEWVTGPSECSADGVARSSSPPDRQVTCRT